MRVRSGMGSLLAVILCSGCFTYVRIDPHAVVPGRDVRVELTDAGTSNLAALIGPGMRAVDGRVIRFDTAAVQLSVTQTTDQRSIEHPWQGETVTVPQAFIAGMEQRRFSRTRTALVAGGILAVVVVSGVAVHNAGASSHGGGSHGGT